MATQKEVRQARRDARITAAQAARLVHVATETWQRWEGQTSRETEIPQGLWELFLLKTGQDPQNVLLDRASLELILTVKGIKPELEPVRRSDGRTQWRQIPRLQTPLNPTWRSES